MRGFLRARRIGLVLLGALAAVALVGAVVYAGPSKPGITVQVSPASQSVERGKTATYTVTASSAGGFAGTVTWSVSGLPTGASASFAPSSGSLTASGTGSSRTSTLTVATEATTSVGTFNLSIIGTSGKISGSVSAGLTVNRALPGSLSMSATPATVTMEPGSVAVYAIQLSRSGISGVVDLRVLAGLPPGATATFAPNPASGTTATLEVATSSSTPDGSSTLYVVASGKDSTGTLRYAYASVGLVLQTSRRSFTISGSLPGTLSPGKGIALPLQLSNPSKKALDVTNLTVTIESIDLAAGVTAVCTPQDYVIHQYSGPYPLAVPAQGETSLAQLGVSDTQWPQVRMVNRPVNQDGCKGAMLRLAYSGSGQGN